MRVKQHSRRGLPTLLWRFWITGRPLWGPGDNATFLHDATQDYRGGPVERLGRARWRRVAARWALLAVPAAAWYLGGWWALTGYLTVALGLGGTLAARGALALWRGREYQLPVWRVVCRVLGERYSPRAAVRSVQLRPAGEDGEVAARILLPVVPLDESARKRVVSAAAERLGIADAAASWMVKGARAHVDVSVRLLPPRTLTYAECRAIVEAADPAKPFVGLAADRKPVYADLDNDGPHIGVSGGTGTGKSTLMRLVLAQRMAAGAGVVCCDYKVTSHTWLRKIAQRDPHRAVYLMDEGEIHEGIMAVFAEFQRRREVLKVDASALDEFRDVDLVVEELNSLASMLRAWWAMERKRLVQEAKDMDVEPDFLPTVCPSVSALAALVQMGRELRIRVHFLAQRLDASAIAPKDGGAVRESITNRFLAKYTKQTWDMLCKGVPFQAFPGGPRGIWTAVVNGEVTFFRVPPMSDQQATELALSSPTPAGPVLGGRRLENVGPQALEGGVTIREALGRLTAPPSLAAARKRVERAKLTAVGQRPGGELEFEWTELEALLLSASHRPS